MIWRAAIKVERKIIVAGVDVVVLREREQLNRLKFIEMRQRWTRYTKKKEWKKKRDNRGEKRKILKTEEKMARRGTLNFLPSLNITPFIIILVFIFFLKVCTSVCSSSRVPLSSSFSVSYSSCFSPSILGVLWAKSSSKLLSSLTTIHFNNILVFLFFLKVRSFLILSSRVPFSLPFSNSYCFSFCHCSRALYWWNLVKHYYLL